jgi:hypothetical protein
MLVLALAILLWAPWITRAYAETRAEQAFSAAWQGVVDGCGFHCSGCGVIEAQKTWFGYRVVIEYGCGMLPEDTPANHQRSAGFVSFLGTVHGFPSP